MYQLQPYRPTGSFFNFRRTPKRSPAIFLSIPLILVMWVGVFGFAINEIDDGALIFLLFGLLAVGSIAILLGITFGLQALVNTRLGQAHAQIDMPRIHRGAEIKCEFLQPVKSRVAVREATIQLVLHEWVKYRQGTDTVVKTHNEVIDEVVVEGQTKNSGQEIWVQGQFRIPDNAMHNLNYANNRLQWLIIVKVDIPAFPDFYEEYTLDFRGKY